ncbi:uncharacterized protein N7459_007924 [Penicillium hispanicum]|uniref:uncharacterized protein n=1 Tax=Penicillium hispanicum TaxID=1080232 RepID=UPI0025405F3D|nr:uncharacterized protein N7459_007924 [Penicillium hispanicum]KAJ5573497.1 hypothetical protein N7459_007924 [Penicillium hispanicum]
MEASTKRYPLAVILPVLSFFSIALCIPPLTLHAKNRNLPATTLICWSLMLNLFNIINSLTWPTDDVASWWNGSGLCDIEVKIMVAGYVAVPGALLCILRSLAIVLDTSRAMLVPSKTQRWRNRSMELLFCVVVPIIAMITHVVWQKSRYLLYSISGCVNNFDESWVSLVLAYMWPPVICLIAGYYCILVLIRLHRYRSDFEVILRSSNSNMSKSRFLRLFLVAFTMLLAILPVQGYVLYYDLTLSLPWHSYSWSRLHGPSWNQIIKVPTYGVVFFDRWTPIAMGCIIFIFCGFGRDATRSYRMVLCYLGLGYCFPSLARPLDSQATIVPPNASGSRTMVGSSDRAKRRFKWRKGSSARYATGVLESAPNKREVSQTADICISVRHSDTYNDIEKGIRTASGPRAPWYRPPWFRFNQRVAPSRDEDTLLEDMSVPSQTICTNAWASTSRSRPSSEFASGLSSPVRNDSIHIKHVISQQSEVQI